MWRKRMNNLILKEEIIIKNNKRMNTMKFKNMEDGTIQVWMNNGDKWTAIRLYPDRLVELIYWLKWNVK